MPATELVTTGSLEAADLVAEPAEVLITGVRRVNGHAVPDAQAVQAAHRHGIDLDLVLAFEKVTGKVGEVTRVPVLPPLAGSMLPQRWLLLGIGDGDPVALRRAGAAAAKTVRGRQSAVVQVGSARTAMQQSALVEGLVLGGYQSPSTGLRARAEFAPVQRIMVTGVREQVLRRALTLSRATVLARDLAATPSNLKSPAWLVDQVRQALAQAESGSEPGSGTLSLQVWDVDRLAAEGFGGLLAVGRGSARPPALVRIDYVPERTAGRRRWCWSARASPSTPAASASNRTPGWL